MGSSSLSEDYRLCLERELRRGRAGVCGDPSLRAVLWQILVEDFDLHGALGDDALALLTDGLWGRADLAPALRDLARAFELLELAAVHLYLLPWRKEFTTIKVSGGAEASRAQAVGTFGGGGGGKLSRGTRDFRCPQSPEDLVGDGVCRRSPSLQSFTVPKLRSGGGLKLLATGICLLGIQCTPQRATACNRHSGLPGSTASLVLPGCGLIPLIEHRLGVPR